MTPTNQQKSICDCENRRPLVGICLSHASLMRDSTRIQQRKTFHRWHSSSLNLDALFNWHTHCSTSSDWWMYKWTFEEMYHDVTSLDLMHQLQHTFSILFPSCTCCLRAGEDQIQLCLLPSHRNQSIYRLDHSGVSVLLFANTPPKFMGHDVKRLEFGMQRLQSIWGGQHGQRELGKNLRAPYCSCSIVVRNTLKLHHGKYLERPQKLESKATMASQLNAAKFGAYLTGCISYHEYTMHGSGT